MRNTPNFHAEKFRVAGHPRTNSGFFLRDKVGLPELRMQVSDGLGWDHVSVSLATRCPTWEEMCWAKELFFRDDEIAFQLHVAKADHISFHPFCLHLWRPQTTDEIAKIMEAWGDEWVYGEVASPGTIPLPPSFTVAPAKTKDQFFAEMLGS